MGFERDESTIEAIPVGELLDLRDKVALVTGAAGGIGAAIAARVAEAGAAVVVHYRSSAVEAEELAASIVERGVRAVAVGADLTEAASVEEMFSEISANFDRMDILINNAGIYPLSPLTEMPETEWDAVIDANLKSTHLCTQAAARAMIARGKGGAVVNIASVEGETPAPMHSHYTSAKAGVLMHTRSAALELGEHGIRVNAVSPGLIWREGIEQEWPEGVERWRATAPLGRMGRAEEIADACLFLVSPASRWISGANLVVDGGVLARPVF